MANPSLRTAINLKCRDCLYDPESGLGTWREQIAQCPAVDCPLWPVRPGPESGACHRSRLDDELRRRAEKGRRAVKSQPDEEAA